MHSHHHQPRHHHVKKVIAWTKVKMDNAMALGLMILCLLFGGFAAHVIDNHFVKNVIIPEPVPVWSDTNNNNIVPTPVVPAPVIVKKHSVNCCPSRHHYWQKCHVHHHHNN